MWGRDRSDLDEREEVQSHIRIEADRLEAEGLAPDEALAAARAQFGYTPHLDPLDSSLRPKWFEVLIWDTRYALRRLIASPITSATILASLVIGIGVNTAIFSLADQALVRSLPVDAPDELVQLEWEGRFIGQGGRGAGHLIPHALFLELGGDQEVFQDMAARSPGEVTLLAGDRSERVQTELVTGSYFRMLGIRPALGRLFSEDDDRIPDAHPIVILSHDYWQSRFAGDSTVIGRLVRVNARPMSVVGVAPKGFHGTDWSQAPAIWLPMMMNDVVHEWGRLDERRIRFQHVFARLDPGVTPERAEAALAGWFQGYLRADIQREGWPDAVEPSDMEQYLASALRVRPGRQGQARRDADLRQPMLILSASTALLLLLACLNVANLSMAKAVARQKDTAVRTALGASRHRIVMERVVEAGLLAAVGGAVGVALAPAISRWTLSYLSMGSGEMALSAQLDGRALATALGISVVATLLSGAGPAWFAAAARPMGALKIRGGSAGAALGVRRALVIGQVSLALVLLMGAGLFGKSLRSLRSEGPGFSAEQLLTFKVTPANEGYELLESKRALRTVLDELQRDRTFGSAGVAVFPVMDGGGWGNTVLIEGAERMETQESLPMNAVSPGYFDALGVSIVLGRDFDARDVWEEDGWVVRSAIVSESFVERYLPNQHPLGVRIDFGGDPSRPARVEIVGVVQGYREHHLRESTPQVFFPIWERTAGTGTFYVRSASAFETLAPAVREIVREVDPVLSVTDLRTFEAQIDQHLVFERMLAELGRAFALFATLLGMIGVYAVLSFSAESRTKEMGLRAALGAPQRAAAVLILGEALRLGTMGIAMALPVIWALGGLIESQLFGVEVVDLQTVGTAVLILLAVVFGAGAVPAWRMSHVSALEAFRVD